jgi:WD40 repeat protein
MWSHRLAATIRALGFSADGRTLYTSDNTCRVYAWDTVSGQRRMVLKHKFISGQVPASFIGTDRFVVFRDTNPLQVWDFTTKAKRLDVPERFASGLARVDAARARLLALAADGKSILSWDLVRQKRGPAVVRWAKPVRPVWRNGFQISADGRTLAVEESRGQIIFRELPSGAEIGRMPLQNDWVTTTPILLSSDGRRLCCIIGYQWRLWDVPAGTSRSESWWWPLAFHPTAPLCAVQMAGSFALVSTQTDEIIRAYDFELGMVQHACFSPDGLTCAVGGSNKQFAVFDVDL